MPSYPSLLKERLREYKACRLKVAEDGVWRQTGEKYGHILPPEPAKLREHNIIRPYRAEFWRYFAEQADIKLHRDFLHLNSSQAMCLNLFFPFVAHGPEGLAVLADVLLFEKEKPVEAVFEKVFPKKPDEKWKEGTNFDFYMRMRSGRQAFFELKLSERDFGSVQDWRNKPNHQRKRRELYLSRLKDIDPPKKCLKPDYFFTHYQILRNISYLSPAKPDHLFFVFPEANAALEKHVDAIHDCVGRAWSRMSVLPLEVLVGRMLAMAPLFDARFRKHYEEFAYKYMIEPRTALFSEDEA